MIKSTMRTEEEYIRDKAYEQELERQQTNTEMKKYTDNLTKHAELRDKQLLDFVGEQYNQQVERQFKR